MFFLFFSFVVSIFFSVFYNFLFGLSLSLILLLLGCVGFFVLCIKISSCTVWFIYFICFVGFFIPLFFSLVNLLFSVSFSGSFYLESISSYVFPSYFLFSFYSKALSFIFSFFYPASFHLVFYVFFSFIYLSWISFISYFNGFLFVIGMYLVLILHCCGFSEYINIITNYLFAFKNTSLDIHGLCWCKSNGNTSYTSFSFFVNFFSVNTAASLLSGGNFSFLNKFSLVGGFNSFLVSNYISGNFVSFYCLYSNVLFVFNNHSMNFSIFACYEDDFLVASPDLHELLDVSVLNI